MSGDTIRVLVPLTVMRRNGRPKILPPEPERRLPAPVTGSAQLRALGRAWAWRRKLEAGEATTIDDIAKAEKVTGRFVSCIMRLGYLSPDVLERMLLGRESPAVSVNELIDAYLPWAEQTKRAFGN